MKWFLGGLVSGIVLILTILTLSKPVDTKRPETLEITPTQSQNQVSQEISSPVEPLEKSIFSITKRQIEKNSVAPIAEGFSRYRYEYYEYRKSFAYNGQDYLNFQIFSKDFGKNFISTVDLYGKNLDRSKYLFASFMENSNTVFTLYNTDTEQWVLGWVTTDETEIKNNLRTREMNLVLKEKIAFDKQTEFTQISQHKYYLTTSKDIYVITPDKEGKTLVMKKLDLPEGYTPYGIKVNQTGNLAIIPGLQSGMVLDTVSDKILEPDSSCIKPITLEMKEKYPWYYNSYVDPFGEGPYKSIRSVPGKPNTYEQTVQNAGCVSREGTIKIFSQGDKAYCDIEIEYELIGC